MEKLRDTHIYAHINLPSISGDAQQHLHKPPVLKKDLTKVLTRDNKLTLAAKARRLEQSLCTYCAGPHKLEGCHVKPATSRARSVRIAEPSTPDVVPGKARANSLRTRRFPFVTK